MTVTKGIESGAKGAAAGAATGAAAGAVAGLPFVPIEALTIPLGATVGAAVGGAAGLTAGLFSSDEKVPPLDTPAVEGAKGRSGNTPT